VESENGAEKVRFFSPGRGEGEKRKEKRRKEKVTEEKVTEGLKIIPSVTFSTFSLFVTIKVCKLFRYRIPGSSRAHQFRTRLKRYS
jgi:hypothetical protein